MGQKEKLAAPKKQEKPDDEITTKVKELINVHGVSILYSKPKMIPGISRRRDDPKYISDLLCDDAAWYGRHKKKVDALEHAVSNDLGTLVTIALRHGWPEDYLRQRLVRKCNTIKEMQLNCPEQCEYCFEVLLNVFRWYREKNICKSEKHPSWRYRIPAFFKAPAGGVWKVGKALTVSGVIPLLVALIAFYGVIYSDNKAEEKSSAEAKSQENAAQQAVAIQFSDGFMQMSDQLRELIDLQKREPVTQTQPQADRQETTTADAPATEPPPLTETLLDRMKTILESFVNFFDGMFNDSVKQEFDIRGRVNNLIENIKKIPENVDTFVQEFLTWVQKVFNKITGTLQPAESTADFKTTQEPPP